MVAKCFGLILTLLTCAPVFAEVITCSTDTLAAYRGLTSGCMSGPFTLKNFNWNSSEGDPFVRVRAEDVFVSPSYDGGSISVDYFSSFFSVGAGKRIYATLDYTIDPPPEILDDFTLDLGVNSPVAPGFATVNAFLCAGDYFSNGCASGVTRFVEVTHRGGAGENILISRAQFPRPVSIIDVRMTILLDAGATGSSQINGFGQTTLVTPEPAAGGFAGAGLLVLFALAKRRKRS